MEIQKVGGGMYQMDGVTYDLGTLMMAIGFERAENIEAQIVDQANAMKKRNALLEQYSKLLAGCRSKSKGMHVQDFTLTDPETGQSINGKDFMEQYGPWPIPGDKGKDGKWSKTTKEAAIEAIKGKMDSLNSDSQMDMIRLQGLMSKRDNIYQAITNLMKKDEGSKSTVVSNLR